MEQWIEATLATAGLGAVGSVIAGLFIFALIALVVIYLYTAFAVMTIARKTKDEPAWLAFIPIANVYLLWKMSRTPTWSIILVFVGLVLSLIPFIGALFALGILAVTAWWWYEIAGRAGHAKWLGLLVVLGNLIPLVGGIVGLVVLGMMAWSKKPIGR